MDPVVAAFADFGHGDAFEKVFLDGFVAGSGEEGRKPVHVVDDLVADLVLGDLARPADHRGHTPRAFPVGVLLTPERRHPGIRPGVHVRTVVGRVEHDGVVGDAQLVELVEEDADIGIMLDHAGGVLVDLLANLLVGQFAVLVADMGAEVHARAAPPHEPGRALLVGALDEVDRRSARLVINGLHADLRQRAGVLDLAVGVGVDHAARAEGFAEGLAIAHHHVARVILVLGLFLGVEVVEVAEELVEAVVRRQVLVAVTEVVLAELAGGVALGLEQARDGRILDLHAFLGARQADLREAGAEHRLPHDERRAAGGAGLLTVVIGEDHAFVRDAVDVGCLVPHHPLGVG